MLRGFRSERDAVTARRALAAFDSAPMVGREIALKAAENDRTLRRRGITVRRTIDLLIGTFCTDGAHERNPAGILPGVRAEPPRFGGVEATKGVDRALTVHP